MLRIALGVSGYSVAQRLRALAESWRVWWATHRQKATLPSWRAANDGIDRGTHT